MGKKTAWPGMVDPREMGKPGTQNRNAALHAVDVSTFVLASCYAGKARGVRTLSAACGPRMACLHRSNWSCWNEKPETANGLEW